MNLNELGKMVDSRLKISAEICREIELDERIIMPNHIHFIIWIAGACATRPGSDYPSNFGQGAWHAPLRQSKSIAPFVGLFKSKTTSISRKMSLDDTAKLWQRNYHERVIRDERELYETRKYILDNPLKWGMDPEYA
ncbi:MAG: transposase [Patescibacteria group bacterium]